jgi:hypothetical protein
VQDIQTAEELERFLMDHGEQIIDTLGQEVDRIERNIKVSVDQSLCQSVRMNYEVTSKRLLPSSLEVP